MMRKMWIVMALAAMILALCCGGALAVEREVSGTVKLSTLPWGASVILKDDTTLVVDEDKVLESIVGEQYVLTIEGSGNLTIEADENAIWVKSLFSDFSGTLTAKAHCMDFPSLAFNTIYAAIYAAEKISISHLT